MSSNPHNLVVGQQLWYASYDQRGHNKPHAVEVLTIGRKWAGISGAGLDARIDLITLVHDGHPYSPYGVCYLSQAIYESEVAIKRDWRMFQRQIEGMQYPPAHLSHDELAQMRHQLRIDQEAV